MFKEAQKLRLQKSGVKTMLTVFFDTKCIIRHEFMVEKQTAIGKFYKEIIKESGFWYILHDNAPAHSSGCHLVFGETRDPRVIPSILLP
jgi:hypothetical protein